MKRFLLFAVAALLFAACSNDATDIQPIIEPQQPYNEIWYTATAKVDPFKADVFGANILSNEWDEATGNGVITFDDEIKVIGEYAFYACDKLISVIIPNGVTEIAGHAFFWSDNLASVTIPDSVTLIGSTAFSSCSKLAEFKGKYASDGGRCLIMDNTIIAYAEASGTTYNIPDGVIKIGDSAFYACSSLTSVTIPDSVTVIGKQAFSGCTKLAEFKGKYAADGGRCLIIDNTIVAYAEASGTTYNIPDGVAVIGNSTFGACLYLTSVTIPDSVTKIGDMAFSYCVSLTGVTIPESVTEIGDYAFCACQNLSSVHCKATTPPTLGGTYVFDDNGGGRKIYVLTESVEAYKSATHWSEYADAIVGYDFENGAVVE